MSRPTRTWLAGGAAVLVLSSVLASGVHPSAAASCNPRCTIWASSVTPSLAASSDTRAVELGVKFRSDVDGQISAIRFYKGATNTGTHVGTLWSSGGTKLASTTFTSETATGWQEASFSTPVRIKAATTYVASYHAPLGGYAYDGAYFAGGSVESPPLHALGDGVDGGNGVYVYGSSSGFPTNSYNAANYWVDVVFSTVDTPPGLATFSPASGAKDVPLDTLVTATFDEDVDPATISFELQAGADPPVPATTSYDSPTRTATLDPTGDLRGATAYTATVSGAKDASGNTMTAVSWSFTTAPSSPNDGPGGPVLIVTNGTNPFTRYYAEILRNEGLNAFSVADVSTLTSEMLAAYDVVVLGETTLTSAQVTVLSDWVTAGGNLIAMRPDKKLAGLLGLADASSTLSNGYLLVDTSAAPGAGIVGQTIQFHGAADRYNLNGATPVAALYATATTATNNPAVTLRAVGTSGGQAGAFTYDLARSVVYTRQGRPDWAGQERDGYNVIRTDDLFYGAASSDPQPDWIDFNKVAIPQADEQQRLLVNLIEHVNADRKPLPRFWYLPNGKKAAVVMTGDDHGSGGTGPRFDTYKLQSPAGCSVENWECIRASSYIYTGTPLTDAAAASYSAEGFEVGLHVNTGCADYTSQTQLDSFFTDQLAQWKTKYASLPTPDSIRTHCIPWSDWGTQPKVTVKHGMRLDTNSYYWPPEWIADRPGFFTGSGMPMRFAQLDGSMTDVYQASTQMTDESGQTYPNTADTLFDRALGPEGYYGVFTANMHTDYSQSAPSDAIVASAKARGVPVVSGRQMLQWLDGRNNSSFGSLSWSTDTLSFTVTLGAGANGIQGMLPSTAGGSALSGLARDGQSVAYRVETIKGISYALFDATGGSYRATYGGVVDPPPTVTAQSPAPGATGVTVSTTVSATFSEDVQPDTISFTLAGPDGAAVAATNSYDAATRTATLDPSADLAASTTYTATVSGAKDAAGNAMTSVTWSFTTAAPACPCTIWPSSATPALASTTDPNAVELGVKFRTDVAGSITGIRFYKGSDNTGTHVGNLWSATGTKLASATFTNETASGWQQVSFSSPVAVSADTTYVASYHAPVGRYAFEEGYFASQGVDSPPLRALASGVDGQNGVYLYGSGGFPSNSYNATNYWVDVVFVTSTG